MQTALNNGLDPEKYIKHILEEVEHKDIEELMPWNVKVKNICGIEYGDKITNPVIPD